MVFGYLCLDFWTEPPKFSQTVVFDMMGCELSQKVLMFKETTVKPLDSTTAECQNLSQTPHKSLDPPENHHTKSSTRNPPTPNHTFQSKSKTLTTNAGASTPSACTSVRSTKSSCRTWKSSCRKECFLGCFIPGHPKECFLEVFCYIKPTKKHNTHRRSLLGHKGFPLGFGMLSTVVS